MVARTGWVLLIVVKYPPLWGVSLPDFAYRPNPGPYATMAEKRQAMYLSQLQLHQKPQPKPPAEKKD